MTAAILNGTLLSVLFAAVIWLALRLTPRRALNAATRYVIWWAGLVCSLSIPAIFLEARQTPVPPTLATGELHIGVLNLQTAAPTNERSPLLPLTVPAGAWLRWLPLAWLFASAILLLRLVLSHFAVRRACAGAAEPPPELRTRTDLWRAAAGFRGAAVVIVASDKVSVPFAGGPFGPTIMIPMRLFAQLSVEDIDRIGLHEAAHLARLDDCAILAERLLIAIFPWHIAALWIARQIDTEREIACDDRVVEATGCPRRYAECLTRVVESCGGLSGSLATAGIGGRGTHLSRRVQLLIDAPRHGHSRLRPARLLPFTAGLLALLLVSARIPRLVAFTAPLAPKTLASIPIFPEEKKMTLPTVKHLGRKLAVATAASVALASATPPQAATPPQQAQVSPVASGRKIVVLLDVAGLPASDLERASDAITKFVQTQMLPDDKVAVLISTDGSNDGGVRVRQDFTGDRSLLTDTVRMIANEPHSVVPGDPRPLDRWATTLSSSVKMLGSVTGKKMLIYVAGRSQPMGPEQLRTLVGDAVRADVAFYPVDVRGFLNQ